MTRSSKGFWIIRRRNSTVEYLPTVVATSPLPWSAGSDSEPSSIQAVDAYDDLSTSSSNSSGEDQSKTASLEIALGCSSNQVQEQPQPHLQKKWLKKQSSTWRQPVDVETYMARREMTKLQERWNALTMLPYPAYCLYYLLSAQWFFQQDSSRSPEEAVVSSLPTMKIMASSSSWLLLFGATDEYGCLPPSSWHSMPCLPPTPVLAVALGVMAHAPSSFLYHWCYAHTLPPVARSHHWSRRMDQALIHVCSIFACCGTATSIPIHSRQCDVQYRLCIATRAIGCETQTESSSLWTQSVVLYRTTFVPRSGALLADVDGLCNIDLVLCRVSRWRLVPLDISSHHGIWSAIDLPSGGCYIGYKSRAILLDATTVTVVVAHQNVLESS